MLSKLPDLNFDEEIEKYNAYASKQELTFKRCNHSQLSYDQTKAELRCSCGVAFSGPRLSELAKTLDKINKKSSI